MHGSHGDLGFRFGLGVVPFAALTFILGFFMPLGSAAVFRHIPVYYPDHVGPVGGAVSMVGGLGGFVLPVAFGLLNDLTGLWTSCFMLLFLIAAANLLWMHAAILRMECAAAAAASPRSSTLWGEGDNLGEPLVVVGNGMAATRFVDELMRRALGRYSVIVIGAEPRLSYNRTLLSSLLAGDIGEAAIELKPRGWWNRHGVTTLHGQAVVAIDRRARVVTLANGQTSLTATAS